jgi:ferredoxin-NADP reductase
VFLAGGIGITPMRSIVEWATQERLPHRLILFYSNRTPAAAAFLPDFAAWAQHNPQFKLIATVTDAKDPAWPYEFGRINKDLLTRQVPDLHQAIYYLAGPPAMVTGMRQLLDSLGISEDNLKTEEFAGY